MYEFNYHRPGTLESAAAANPNAPVPRLTLVNVLLEGGDSDRALVMARELVQIAPENPDALDALARAQFAAGQQTSAIATYRQLARFYPQSPVIQHRLGRALAATENYADARIALDSALAQDPSMQAAWRDRIEIERIENGVDAALALAQTVPDKIPDSSFGHILIGDLLQRAGRHEAAVETYNAAFEKQPSGALVTRLFRGLAAAGRADRGRDLLKQWLADHPKDADVRFLWASELIRGQKYEEAIVENESLLERFPDNAVLLNDLAWLYGVTDDARAMDYAERAYALAPSSPAISDTLGWLLVQNGDAERGLELLKAARAGAPEQPEIGYHLAVALAETGNTVEARIRLKAVLDSGKTFEGIEDARKLYDQLSQ